MTGISKKKLLVLSALVTLLSGVSSQSILAQTQLATMATELGAAQDSTTSTQTDVCMTHADPAIQRLVALASTNMTNMQAYIAEVSKTEAVYQNDINKQKQKGRDQMDVTPP